MGQRISCPDRNRVVSTLRKNSFSTPERSFARPTAIAAAARVLLCLGLAAGTVGVGVFGAQNVQAQNAPARQAFRLPAGSLDQTLNRFAGAAGIELSVDAALTAGKNSAGLTGSYTVDEAFNEILKGQNLAPVRGANGSYSLRRAMPGSEERGQNLPAVQVTAEAERGATTEGSRSYTAPLLTMNKGEQALKDIPQSLSVLTRQRLDDQGITDLRAAANSVTGVVGVQGVGPGMVITARGFQIDDWQYDGVAMPRNNYALGNWATEGLVFYDRVEVLRGASNLMQGVGSPGGAVNLVRKRGQKEPTVTVTGKAGSWDRYGLQVDAGGPLNKEGTLRGRIVLDEDRAHSFIDSVWSNTRSMYAALDYDISRDTTIGVGVSHVDNDGRPTFIGFPRYADMSAVNLPRSTFSGAWWNRSNSEQTNIYADLQHRFNSLWSFNFSAINMKERNASVHQRVANSVATNGSGLRYGDFAIDYGSEKSGFDTYLRGKFDLFALKQEVILGASYSRYNSTDAYANAWTSGANIFAIDHDRPWQDFASIAARGAVTRSQYSVYQRGLYGSWRAQLAEPLTAVVGGRFSWYSNRYIGASSTSEKTESGKFTPYAGLIYALNKQWSLYTSYTSVFEPQSERGADNSALAPITGKNYEAGVKGELMDGRVNTSLAVFRYDHNNRAVSDVAGGFACDGWYCSRASGKVRSQGAEAEISGEVLRGLQLFAGYAFVTTKYLEDPDSKGKVFSTWTPKNMLRLWADYKLPGELSKLSIGGGMTTQSNTLAWDSTFKVPGFTIWNARIGYELTPEVSLALNINNLFDKTYYIPSYNTVASNNYYGDPRNLMLTVKYTPKF